MSACVTSDEQRDPVLDHVDAVVTDCQPEVTGEQGLRSLALVFGLLESERLGRMISLNEVLERRDLPYEMAIREGLQA